MTASLEQELKEFEKQLSLLLVRFMKIHDQLEASKAAPQGPEAPPNQPVAPQMAKPDRWQPAYS